MLCLMNLKVTRSVPFYYMNLMVIQVVEFFSRGYKIRKMFA